MIVTLILNLSAALGALNRLRPAEGSNTTKLPDTLKLDNPHAKEAMNIALSPLQ